MKIYSKLNKFLASSKYSKPFNSCLVLLIAVSYVFRAHPYILHPQFYAEDGTLWLAGAYDNGIRSLFQPYNQFSQLFERVFALFSVHFVPLLYEPAFYMVAALLIFLLLSYYLLSSRSGLLTSNYQRLFVALSLCLLANAQELYANFSNSVFYLGLVGLLIVIVSKSRHRYVDWLEKALFLVLCFTSAFAWIYLLILLVEFFWYHRKKYYYLALAAIGSLTQLLIYSSVSGSRANIPLSKIVSNNTVVELYNQIINPSLRFGRLDINPLAAGRSSIIFAIIALVLAGLVATIVFFKSDYRTKYVLLFCLIMTLLSLRSPADVTSVAAMAISFSGNRYFISGILGMFVVWAKFSQGLFKQQYLAPFLLIFFTFALLSSIRLGSFFIQRNLFNMTSQYSAGVKHFTSGHGKRTEVIPINPPGWIMILKKD